MRLLRAFDTWFLDICERFSQKTQRTFGITCFALARISLVLWGLSTGVFCHCRFWLEGIVLSSIYLMALSLPYLETFNEERQVESFALRGLANPAREFGLERFLVFPGGLALIIVVLIDGHIMFLPPFWFVFYMLFEYFRACNPLPPAKSKVRAFIEKIRESLSPAEIPTPQES